MALNLCLLLELERQRKREKYKEWKDGGEKRELESY